MNASPSAVVTVLDLAAFGQELMMIAGHASGVLKPVLLTDPFRITFATFTSPFVSAGLACGDSLQRTHCYSVSKPVRFHMLRMRHRSHVPRIHTPFVQAFMMDLSPLDLFTIAKHFVSGC
jgi:hypothetical protein